jgi:hypothetical protein
MSVDAITVDAIARIVDVNTASRIVTLPADQSEQGKVFSLNLSDAIHFPETRPLPCP